jgi:hypothetical protein
MNPPPTVEKSTLPAINAQLAIGGAISTQLTYSLSCR